MGNRLKHGGRVFLTAPLGADIEPIIGLCRKHGLTIVSLDDVSFGATVRDQLATMIGNSDIVIALFLGKNAAENVAYEVGIAHGLNKPTLILADQEYRVPTELHGQHMVFYDNDSLEAADFWLQQLLEAPAPESERVSDLPSKSHRRSELRDWLELSDRVRSSWHSQLHSETESLVREALEKAGVDFLSQADFGHVRPDFAGWVDELEGALGNPFLIEVKGSQRSRADRRRAFNQVKRFLDESNSRWALVLFVDGPKRPIVMHTEDRRKVLFERFDEFARGLATGDFASTVKRLASRAIHEAE